MGARRHFGSGPFAGDGEVANSLQLRYGDFRDQRRRIRERSSKGTITGVLAPRGSTLDVHFETAALGSYKDFIDRIAARSVALRMQLRKSLGARNGTARLQLPAAVRHSMAMFVGSTYVITAHRWTSWRATSVTRSTEFALRQGQVAIRRDVHIDRGDPGSDGLELSAGQRVDGGCQPR